MSAITEGVAPVRDITIRPPGLAARKFKDRAFIFWGILATLIGLGTLVALVWDLANDGAHRVTLDFFFSFPSSDPAEAGIYSAWIGSILVIITTAFIAIPVGVLAGIYLEEYAPKNAITSAIEIAVNNLAGVPSIIYGLLAVGLFVQVLALGQSVLTGGHHVVALDPAHCHRRNARGGSQRAAGNAPRARSPVGATKWQATAASRVCPTHCRALSPASSSASRAPSVRTAPLILIGGLTFVAFLPITLPGDAKFTVVGAVDEYGRAGDAGRVRNCTDHQRRRCRHAGLQRDGRDRGPKPLNYPTVRRCKLSQALAMQPRAGLPSHWLGSEFTVMPIQMFNWTSRPQAEFLEIAAAAGLVLLAITLLLNGTAIWLRYRLRKAIKW